MTLPHLGATLQSYVLKRCTVALSKVKSWAYFRGDVAPEQISSQLLTFFQQINEAADIITISKHNSLTIIYTTLPWCVVLLCRIYHFKYVCYTTYLAQEILL